MSDYNFLMETRLTPEQFQVVTLISRAAAEQGLNLYLAGGAIRDLTFGQQNVHDLDFVTEGNPNRMLRYLESRDGGRKSAGEPASPVAPGPALKVLASSVDERLNLAEVEFSNGVHAEIAMSRSEAFPKPGHAPEIAPAMIFDDLKRRDFSINAMAVSLHPNSRGLLLDPTNGAADIEKRELRVMHSRSFSDDPSRIYRLLRLGLRLGFKPEERTQIYLERALENRWWEQLEPEQQGRELWALLQEDNPGRVLKMLGERGILSGLEKKLKTSKASAERFARIRAVCQSVHGANPSLLNFHCLVQSFPAGQRGRLAKKILGDARTIQTALGQEHAARKLAQSLASAKFSLPSRAYKLLLGQPQNLLLFLLTYHPQAKIQSRVKSFLHKYPVIWGRLPRAELLAMGMKPGPKFEKVLEQVFFDQLDGKIKTPQQITKALRALSGIKEPPPPLKPPKPPKTAAAAKPSAPVPAPAIEAKRGARPPEPPKPDKPSAPKPEIKRQATSAKKAASSKKISGKAGKKKKERKDQTKKKAKGKKKKKSGR